MKCIFILTLVGLVHIHANILGQQISLSLQNVTVKQALKEIEKQCDFVFMYDFTKIDVNKAINIHVSNEPVENILRQITRETDSWYEIIDKQIVLIPKLTILAENAAIMQGISITGTITDSDGAPLPGASVVIKGSTQGTVANINGSYAISVPDGNTILEFSFVGFANQEIVVGNQRVVNVTLKETVSQLDEVVVVGYGTQTKRTLTGSVAKVDVTKLENLPNTNVAQALRGKVAGVQFTDNGRPGQDGTILIRGQRSITASNTPLIIVDEMFYNGGLSEINFNDVESVEILKDASAAAIYGSRAANGVILITTKKGTSEKPTIRFNGFAGVSEWNNEIKLQSPERYLQRKLDYRKQAGLESIPANIDKYLCDSERENYLAGKTVDPWEVISQTGVIQSYDLSVSGRTERVNYYISGALTKEKGIVFNDKADRMSFRMNVESKVTNWLNVGVTSQFSHRNTSGVVASISDAYYFSPFGDVYQKDDPSRLTSRPVSESNAGGRNPLFAATMNQNEIIQQNLFANFYALVDIPFVKGLTYRLNYSPNLRWAHNYESVPEYKDNYIAQVSSAVKNGNQNFDWSLENILNYARRFENHRINATLMYGRSHRGYESTSASGDRFINDKLGWNKLSLAEMVEIDSDSWTREEISSMFRVNYSFMDRYLLTLTARRDGSSVFGENNKYAVFPSIAFAWNASEESFVKSITPIDLLKLRVSYGTVGNQAINPYQSLSSTSDVQYVFGDGATTSIGVYPSSMANSSLKWETSKTLNLAVDFLLLKGRIGGTVEFYNVDTDDLLLNRALPTMTGFTSVLSNIGATNNKGIEITLNTVNIRSGKFEWSTDLVFSTNKNKIVHLYKSDINGDGKEDDDVGNRWFIGHPISVYFDYETNGIWQVDDDIPAGFKAGDFRLVNQDDNPAITADDRKILYQRQPKYRWGLTNTFRYSNWSLTVFVNSLKGWMGDFRQLGMMGVTQPNYPERANNGIDAGWWTEENRSNTRPRLNYLNPMQHNFYVSRDFIRIQEISLSYEFPKGLISKWSMNGLKAYVSVKNLYTFTDYIGFDPENTGSGLGYPMPRTLVGGINISF